MAVSKNVVLIWTGENIFFLEYAGELHIIALRRGKRPK